MAWGFSSLAMIQVSKPRAATRLRTRRTSSAVRTKETAMASAPLLRANSRSSASFSVREGTRTGMPGRLMPLFSPSMPPLTISQTTSSPRTSWTRSSMRPSESRMREPCSTFSARVLKVVPTMRAVPWTSRGVMVRRPPALSSTAWWSLSLEVRILGPCRSAMIQSGLRSSRLTLRIIWIKASFSSWVP